MHHSRTQYLVVGGGAGGLQLASMLGRKFGPSRVALVDASLYHVWKPSLHEAAAGSLDIQQEGLPYQMLGHDNGFQFIYGRMTGLDAGARTISIDPVCHGGEQVLPARVVAFGSLILAVGSTSNYFGIPGAAEHAHALNCAEDAEAFRNRFLAKIAAAEHARIEGRAARVDIVIIGGGATGVELAAELHGAARSVGRYRQPGPADSVELRLRLLDGGPRILAALPERVSHTARRLLAKRGIDVVTSCRVASVEAHAVFAADGQHYRADMCVWAAGIRAPDLIATLGLPVNRTGQLEVDSYLRVKGTQGIFAIGDCAHAVDSEGKPVPPRAQAAHQQAKYLASWFNYEIGENPLPKQGFRWQDRGSLVSVGRGAGVGNLMGNLFRRTWFVQGWYARLMYASLHILHHKEVLGPWRTLAAGASRILLRRIRPQVKLH